MRAAGTSRLKACQALAAARQEGRAVQQRCLSTFSQGGSLYEFMLRPRPVVKNLSVLCGHASFVMLGLGFLEADVLNLRLYAAGGVTCGMLFQFFRPQPLWLPISWNLLFLGINVGMAALLVRERDEASHVDAEAAAFYERVFRRAGMDPVDFWRLLRLARQVRLAPGEALTDEGEPQHTLYLLTEGQAAVVQGGETIAVIGEYHFIGEVSFANHLNRQCEETVLPAAASVATDAAGAASSFLEITAAAAARGDEDVEAAALEAAEMAADIAAAAIVEAAGAAEETSVTPTAAAAAAVAAAEAAQEQSAAAQQTSLPPVQLLQRFTTLMNKSTLPSPPNVCTCTASARVEAQPAGALSAAANPPASSMASAAAAPAAAAAAAAETAAAAGTAAGTTAAGSAGGGGGGSGGVVAWAWDFDELRAFLEAHPRAGNAVQAAIANDMALRIAKRVARTPLAKYKQMLRGAAVDDVVTDGERRELARLRMELGVSDKEHREALREEGWSDAEFEQGFKEAEKRTLYRDLLARELKGGTVSRGSRKVLREFRAEHKIEPVEHLRILRSAGWSHDEFEEGTKAA
ncbi:unnamed protein product [Phaeothamnion confervicola]